MWVVAFEGDDKNEQIIDTKGIPWAHKTIILGHVSGKWEQEPSTDSLSSQTFSKIP